MKHILLLILAIGLSGCTGTAKMVRAMAKDPASVFVKVQTIYGTATIVRTVPNTNSVTINADGELRQGVK